MTKWGRPPRGLDDLVRVRRRLTRAQLDLIDRTLGWLIADLGAIHRIDRTAAEAETLRQLETLRLRLRARDDT